MRSFAVELFGFFVRAAGGVVLSFIAVWILYLPLSFIVFFSFLGTSRASLDPQKDPLFMFLMFGAMFMVTYLAFVFFKKAPGLWGASGNKRRFLSVLGVLLSMVMFVALGTALGLD